MSVQREGQRTATTATVPPPAGATPARTSSALGSALLLPEVRWALLATVLFALGGLGQLAGAPAPVWWTLYLAAYVAGGWEPALSGLQALREKTLDVDILMIVAALVAAGIGQVFDGALLIVIFATSGALEAFVTRRTEDSVSALLSLAPEQATRLAPDGTEEVVDTDALAVGDVVLVRPGERVGADGEVVDGLSEVDQASITGEPLPVLKQAGDEVFAGTFNGTGALRVLVNRPAHESVVARIVVLVQEASSTKAKTQLFIEKVEQRYSVGVVVATLALFAVPLVLGAALQPSLLRAMTFMIVASPCAVVLATMPPLLAVIANAGRHGVLVKSAVALEELGKVDVVAFDKTGTLTAGTPKVTDVVVLGDNDRDDVVALAAAAEHPSEHPVARAIVAAAHERGLGIAHCEEFGSVPGRGVSATVAGRKVEVGSPALLSAGTGQAEARGVLERLEDAGHTAVVVLVDGAVAGVLGLADRLRAEAAASVAALEESTGNRPVLLTGDNQRAADRLAAEVGIEQVYGGLLPADKVTQVQALKADGRRVLLVGDGVNDAPAMAAADVGVGMGRSGSDLAMETADAILVRDDLATLPRVIALSRRAHRVVKANLVIAALVITGLVLWDVLGTLPLPLGVAGHEGSTVIVGLNGLRLLRRSVWTDATRARPGHDPAAWSGRHPGGPRT
ncbi:MAG: heavy metal translocating P-type ATPase [Nocardioidaceae bacterium]